MMACKIIEPATEAVGKSHIEGVKHTDVMHSELVCHLSLFARFSIKIVFF